jgi:hypothetical protein
MKLVNRLMLFWTLFATIIRVEIQNAMKLHPLEFQIIQHVNKLAQLTVIVRKDQ